MEQNSGSLINMLYIPLTDLVFSVGTVSYGPIVFPLIDGPCTKPAGHQSTAKKMRIHNLHYGPRK